MARALSTFWFWLVFALTAPLVFAGGVLLFVVTAPFDKQRRAIHAYVCALAFNYLRVNPFWRTAVMGRERLPQGPCVLVANHQSMADVIAVMGIHHPFKFVSKASLFGVPVVGWMMRMAKYIAVERGKPSSMQQMMEECRMWLRAGMSVLLFPEGTYATGDRMLPFKRGAFQLAISEKVPLVPVVLQGTRDVVIEDGPWMSPRARVTITVLEPICVSALGDDDAELSQRVRAVFEAALSPKG